MPTISIRGNEMPASPIRKLAPLADAAKQRGVHVFHLNIGQPDIATPEVALKAVRQMKLPVIEYTASAGNHTLRTKLAGYYQKLGISLYLFSRPRLARKQHRHVCHGHFTSQLYHLLQTSRMSQDGVEGRFTNRHDGASRSLSPTIIFPLPDIVNNI